MGNSNNKKTTSKKDKYKEKKIYKLKNDGKNNEKKENTTYNKYSEISPKNEKKENTTYNLSEISPKNEKKENTINYNYTKTSPKNNNNLDIYLKSDLVNDSYAWRQFTNTFTTFKSINNLLFLIYSTETKSIICYDLNREKKYTEIKNAHSNHCINLRHYLDTINKRDIIMSLFDYNDLKLWDAKNFECIIYLPNINKNGYVFSAYLLRDNNINYIITSNYISGQNLAEPVKIFGLNGDLIKTIKNSDETTLILDNYFDKNLSKNYIITGNYNHVKSYDYTSNTIYHKYFDSKNEKIHSDIIIKSDESIIKIIESCNDGYVRIWDLHSGLMLNKINLEIYSNQYSLCLWDNQYLFVGCLYKIVLVDFQENKIIRVYNQKDNPLTMEKVYLSKYGECLISQGMGKDQIKIWLINKK